MHISGPVTLTGGGALALSNSINNRIYGSGSDTLTNDVNNTIQGAGQLGINAGDFAFNLDNKGTILANQSGGTLQVAPTQTVTNTGTMEASNGGTLHLLGSFANTGGLILGTGTNSTVELAGSAIHGGTLTTASGGVVQNTGTAATLDGVTISGGSTVTATNGSGTTLQNTITISNAATLAQSSTGSLTDMHISGPVTLTGGGALALSNSTNNRIYGSGTDTLTNDVNNTIQGAGQLGVNAGGFAFNLDNKGTILANQSAGLQVASAAPVTNEASGVLKANGGTLALIGTFNNSGLIEGLGGSVVQIGGATINGGNLDGQVANNNSATVNGVTINPTGTLTGMNGTSTTLLGTITNNGTMAQSSTGSLTDFHISGNVTLNGTGTFQLSDSSNNRIFAGGADSLTIGSQQTLAGSGQIGVNNGGFAFNLTNNGTVLAN
jgi:filamentous hemagglutinin